MKNYLTLVSFILIGFSGFAQQIEFYTGFNGHYDYTAIGNTMNMAENNTDPLCQILTSSDATLDLAPGQTVEAAYLYWAGSGTGDFNVSLNNVSIAATRMFSHTMDFSHQYFAAFADVTSQIISEGNTTYTLSDLDLTSVIIDYCDNRTNFAGWSIIIIYEDPSLPLNQVTVFDGLEAVSSTTNQLTITLNNLNIIDDDGAKIGFLAWEGDLDLAIAETLKINGNTLSNPPLNPANNAFNGTNSFTGSDTLYNMDIDFYDIENNIQPGDNSVQITLNSGQDLIMINNIVTVFNSQLPDATASIDQVNILCKSSIIDVDYTISNLNCTDILPANALIAFYADGILVGTTATQNPIPIGGSETGNISLTIPPNVPNDFELKIVVDDDGTGTESITEIVENNNSDALQIHLLNPEITDPLEDLYLCGENSTDTTEIFDLTINTPRALGNQTDVSLTYHLSANNANTGNAEITNLSTFQNTVNPQEIFVRLEENTDSTCYITDSFFLYVIPTPIALAPDDLVVCDDPSNDGTAIFDLSQLSATIIDNQPAASLSFHLTSTDASSGSNAIQEITGYQNISNPQTIYVRLENDVLSSCFSTISFQLEVKKIDDTVFLGELLNCDKGFDRTHFNLTNLETSIPQNEIIGYYRTKTDAFTNTNPIAFPTNYENTDNPQLLYVRIDDLADDACYRLGMLEISIKNCHPFIPEGFSPNNDGINDTFEISGLYDIFPNFELTIFSRYGNIVYEGNNDIPAWDGTANHGLSGRGNQVPTGTYYYILNLHDPEYTIFKGWVYLNR